MLIDSFIPHPDAVETHRIEIAASAESVYRALWTADLSAAWVIKALLTIRSLPQVITTGHRRQRPQQKLTLETLTGAGFGLLAEEPGRELVLGIAGRFWRPTGNILPFNRADFDGPVLPGLARAVWNFTVQETATERSILTTETRVVCGDRSSRIKFQAYWLLVRPFSGLIRVIMLREIKRVADLAAFLVLCLALVFSA